MRFGKLKMFFFLNGFIALGLMLYFGAWFLLSNKTVAQIVPPYNANTIRVQYLAKGKLHYDRHLRGDIPFSQKRIEVRYFVLHPSSSRIHTFLGMYAEPLAWWLVFLLASSMLLLMNNTVFSKGTMFQLHKKFPWISMDEYFPAPTNDYSAKEDRKSKGKKIKRLGAGNGTKTLPLE